MGCEPNLHALSKHSGGMCPKLSCSELKRYSKQYYEDGIIASCVPKAARAGKLSLPTQSTEETDLWLHTGSQSH